MAANVRDIDRGWKAIRSNLRSLDDSYTKVGLPSGARVAPPSKKGSGGEPIKSSAELIDIAAFNEFGTKNIPSRPAIRQAFDTNQGGLTRTTTLIAKGVMDRKLSARRGLGIIGEWMTDKIKKQITELRSPVNKPATIARKGSSNPLIDRAQYRNSITHVEVMR